MMVQDTKAPFTAVAPCEKATCGDLKCPATFIPTEVPKHSSVFAGSAFVCHRRRLA